MKPEMWSFQIFLPCPSLIASMNIRALAPDTSAFVLRAPRKVSLSHWSCKSFFIWVQGSSVVANCCPSSNSVYNPRFSLFRAISASRCDLPTPASPRKIRIGLFDKLTDELLINSLNWRIDSFSFLNLLISKSCLDEKWILDAPSPWFDFLAPYS